MAPFRAETWDHSEWARRLYILVVIISACVMAVLFVLIRDDRRGINHEAAIRSTEIQQQRYDATYQNCLDTNKRHDNTIARLKFILRRDVKKGRITKSQAIRSSVTTALLIDALAPRRDCKAVARKAVHPLTNPKG